MALFQLSESETRFNLIYPTYKKAGWNLSDRIQIWFEAPLHRGLTVFLKHVLKLKTQLSYEQIVSNAFDAFILEQNYNADQSCFLRTVQTVFMQKLKLEAVDLYDAPFTNFGNNAVEKYFTPEEIEELMELTKN